MKGLDEYRRKLREAKKARDEQEKAKREERLALAEANGRKIPEGEVKRITDQRTAGLIPWKPGQSGNPTGRPPLPPELKAKLRDLAPKAVQRLGEMLDDDDPRIRGMASQAILDRLYGKPTQAVEAEVKTTSVQQAHLEVLLNLQARREEAIKTIEGQAEEKG